MLFGRARTKNKDWKSKPKPQAGENKTRTMLIRHSKHSVKTRHID